MKAKKVKIHLEIHPDVFQVIEKLAKFSNMDPGKYLLGVINMHAALGSPITYLTDESDISARKQKLN